jgi:hypothetical protein
MSTTTLNKGSKYSRKRPLRLSSLDELGLVQANFENEVNNPLEKVTLIASTSNKGETIRIDFKDTIIEPNTPLAPSENHSVPLNNVNQNEMSPNKTINAKSEVAKKRPRDSRGYFIPKDRLAEYGYTQDYKRIPGFDKTKSPDYVKEGEKTKTLRTTNSTKTASKKNVAPKVTSKAKNVSDIKAKIGKEDEVVTPVTKEVSASKGKTTQKTTGRVSKKGKATESVKEANTIYSTTDYDQFVLEVSNRPINERKAEKLMNDIKEKNLLEAFPIVVKSDMRIMDGQHRFTAAKNLGVPVHYIINDDFDLNDIGKVNSSSTSWTLSQFLSHFVALGYEEYIKVDNFIKEHDVPLYNAVGMLHGRISHPNQQLIQEFKDGKYKIKNITHAMKVVKQRDDMVERSDYAKEFASQKNFINAVAKLTSLDDYDHSMMLDKLSRQPKELRKVPTTDRYLEEMVGIYNHHTPKKKRLSKERVLES